jgi:hypothetical protein
MAVSFGGVWPPVLSVFEGRKRGSERGNLDHAGTDAPTVSSGLKPIQKLKSRIGFAIVLRFPLAAFADKGGGILTPKSGAEGFLGSDGGAHGVILWGQVGPGFECF